MNIGLSSTEEFNAATIDMLASGLILFHPADLGAAMAMLAMAANQQTPRRKDEVDPRKLMKR